MSIYETVLIARQELSAAQVAKLVESFTKIATDLGAKILKTEDWGLRSFAYPINKMKRGHYALVEMEAPAAALHEMERVMRFNEEVVRYMTICRDVPSTEQSPILNKDRDDDRLNTVMEAA